MIDMVELRATPSLSDLLEEMYKEGEAGLIGGPLEIVGRSFRT